MIKAEIQTCMAKYPEVEYELTEDECYTFSTVIESISSLPMLV
jgi:hypothetical protein